MTEKAPEITSKGTSKRKDRQVSVTRGEKTAEQHLEILAPSPSKTNMATSDNSVKPSELQQFGELLSQNMIAMQRSMQQSFSKITDVLSRITEEENPDEDEGRVVETRPEEMAGTSKKSKAQAEPADKIPAESNKDEGALHDIAQSLQLEEKCSPKVAEQLANVVNGVMQTRLSDEVQAERLKAYQRPENCDSLVTVKVNPLIWEKLRSETRSADIKLQKVQTLIIKSVMPSVQVIETLNKVQDQIPTGILDVPALMKQLSDGIALSSCASYELNMRRREAIKPDLNQEYKHLCSSTVPVTEFLFGSDLSQQLKDMAQANRVASKLSSSRKYSNNRDKPLYKQGFKKYKGFGYKNREYNRKDLNSFKPSYRQKRRGEGKDQAN